LKCHIFSDISRGPRGHFGAYSINFGKIQTVQIKNIAGDRELFLSSIALKKAIETNKYDEYIIHTDTNYVDKCFDKKWFNEFFHESILDKVSFYEDARKYVTYKQCHFSARIVAGCYRKSGRKSLLSDPIWLDNDL
jgi:hypothetical protein